VYPTLCQLANLAPPAGLEGQNLTPLLENPSKPLKNAAFSQYPRRGDAVMGYSIRTDRHRYTEWQEDWKSATPKVVARELYDHQADPRETKNIADDATSAKIVEQLAQQLKSGWRQAS
jgi:arylsulfatase A-like enzyme